MSFRKRGQQPEPAAAEAVASAAEAAPADALMLAAEPAAAEAPAPPATPVPSAAARSQAEELVRRVVQELPAFITVAVVDMATSSILAGQWGHSGGATEVAAANTEMVRQINLAVEALHLADTEQFADMLITLSQQLHLLRVLPQPGWLLYLAVHSQHTNPALLRAVAQSVEG